MLPHSIFQYQQKTDALLARMELASSDLDIELVNIFSNILVIKAAGLVEFSIIEILAKYGNHGGNPKVSNFVRHHISRYNSLNCKKIEQIMATFDQQWWPSISQKCRPDTISAIDSLKTIRDQIAHGKDNGTGLHTIKAYYIEAKKFVGYVNEVILE